MVNWKIYDFALSSEPNLQANSGAVRSPVGMHLKSSVASVLAVAVDLLERFC